MEGLLDMSGWGGGLVAITTISFLFSERTAIQLKLNLIDGTNVIIYQLMVLILHSEQPSGTSP